MPCLGFVALEGVEHAGDDDGDALQAVVGPARRLLVALAVRTCRVINCCNQQPVSIWVLVCWSVSEYYRVLVHGMFNARREMCRCLDYVCVMFDTLA